MGYLRQFLNAFQDQAAGVRVYFPDNIVSEQMGLCRTAAAAAAQAGSCLCSRGQQRASGSSRCTTVCLVSVRQWACYYGSRSFRVLAKQLTSSVNICCALLLLCNCLVQELAVARSGQTSDPSAGRQEMAAKFGSDTDFKYGYLTKQSAAWAVLGVNFGNKFMPSSLAKDTDSMYVVSVSSAAAASAAAPAVAVAVAQQ